MNRGDWQATVHGLKESDMTEQLTLLCFSTCTWSLTGYLTFKKAQDTGKKKIKPYYQQEVLMEHLLGSAAVLATLWENKDMKRTCLITTIVEIARERIKAATSIA